MKEYFGSSGEPLKESSYTCLGRIRFDCFKSPAAVEGVSKKHIPGKSRFDVSMFWFVNSRPYKIRQIPANLGRFFPNLDVLKWSAGDLMTLNIKDISQFPHLKALHLSSNKLKILYENVFSNTPEIEFLAIDNNQIRGTGNIFKYLKKVKIMYIANNPCTRRPVKVCGNDIISIRRTLVNYCSGIRRAAEDETTETTEVIEVTSPGNETLSDSDDEDDFEENDNGEGSNGGEIETKYEINVVKTVSDKTCYRRYERITDFGKSGKTSNSETDESIETGEPDIDEDGDPEGSIKPSGKRPKKKIPKKAPKTDHDYDYEHDEN